MIASVSLSKRCGTLPVRHADAELFHAFEQTATSSECYESKAHLLKA